MEEGCKGVDNSLTEDFVRSYTKEMLFFSKEKLVFFFRQVLFDEKNDSPLYCTSCTGVKLNALCPTILPKSLFATSLCSVVVFAGVSYFLDASQPAKLDIKKDKKVRCIFLLFCIF